MRLKQKRFSNNDTVLLLRYALTALLIILVPITLFLTAFSWYGSLEVRATNIDVAQTTLFFKNSLIFGSIGLISSSVYFLIFLILKINLNRADYKWKKILLLFYILGATIIFLLFEIFSIIFIDYYYSWQMSLVLIFWPLLFVTISVILLVDFFSFYNEQKNLALSKSRQIQQERESVIKDQTGFF